MVMAAFGAGVKHATSIVRQEPSFFANVILVGVGSDDWSAGAAGVFAAGRGRRMIFACSDPQCAADSERYMMMSRSVGIETKLVDAGSLGVEIGRDLRVADAKQEAAARRRCRTASSALSQKASPPIRFAAGTNQLSNATS